MGVAIIRQRDLGALLLFAMRYTADRKTGAALMVSTIMKKHLDDLTPEDRTQIIREIEQEHQHNEDWVRFLMEIEG